MELSIKNIERLIQAVEITFLMLEIEYNSLVLRRRIGEDLSDAEKLRIVESMEMSRDYAKLREDLQAHLKQSKSRLSE